MLKRILFFILLTLCFWTFGASLAGFRAIFDSQFFYAGTGSVTGTGARNILFSIFRIGAIILFIVAVILIFIAAIKFFASDASQKDFSNWISTLVWGLAGLFLAAVAYSVVNSFSSKVLPNATLSVDTIYDVVVNIVYPLLNFLRYIAAGCFFIATLIGFYMIITGMGNEESFQKGRSTFFGGIIGFIVMMLAEPIVNIVYGGGQCGGGQKIFGIATDCTNRVFDLEGGLAFVIKIIVFLNGFIALVTLLMIMYAGVLVMTNHGDEEKIGQAKKIITYAVIGILIILFSYVIYRAFMLFI